MMLRLWLKHLALNTIVLVGLLTVVSAGLSAIYLWVLVSIHAEALAGPTVGGLTLIAPLVLAYVGGVSWWDAKRERKELNE